MTENDLEIGVKQQVNKQTQTNIQVNKTNKHKQTNTNKQD